ncbi:hypothetical protein PIB30_014088, partial [Stylosanthes scabra]|nr:hypothetical protein [Stylosanthes scabra]
GFGESVPPCHGYRDARKKIGGIRSTLPRIQGIVKSTKSDPWQGATDSGSWSHSHKYQVVVPGEDERRAKMAEAEAEDGRWRAGHEATKQSEPVGNGWIRQLLKEFGRRYFYR